MSVLMSKNGHLMVKKPVFRKIETEIVGGMATITQRIELLETELVMGYVLDGFSLKPGDTVLLYAEQSLKEWARMTLRLPDGTEFVQCPESAILGYRIK